MLVISGAAKDRDILAIVERWIGLLAAGQSADAMALLKTTGAERDWSPELVMDLIASYEPAIGDWDGTSLITPVETARTEDVKPNPHVDRWPQPNPRGAWGDVHYDLPINGVWSDLTAMFRVREVPGGLALELYDVHVL